jgi:hypothetical protein
MKSLVIALALFVTVIAGPQRADAATPLHRIQENDTVAGFEPVAIHRSPGVKIRD